MEVLKKALHGRPGALKRTAIVTAQPPPAAAAGPAAAAAAQQSELAFTYGRLAALSQPVVEICNEFSSKSHGMRVGIMAPPSAEYVIATWSVWATGGICVPLALSYPASELKYILQDAQVGLVLATSDFADVIKPLSADMNIPFRLLPECAAVGRKGAGARAGDEGEDEDEAANASMLVEKSKLIPDANGCLIIYTSGTTGQPKGVLHTHRSISSQVISLVEAWHWSADDTIIHTLPLHHIHGIVNALFCPLYSGATVEFLPRFSPRLVWDRLASEAARPATVFMGVPTMYVRLLQHLDAMEAQGDRERAAKAAGKLRLTVSGSAACPVPVMEAWRAVSGQTLLERYGMSEIGMALSNPYAGERRPGTVGQPLPFVQAKIVQVENEEKDNGNSAHDKSESESQSGGESESKGELRVRGPCVFSKYWGRPEATAESFDEEGYFKTGDTVAFADGYYRILGRTSVDIIKCGGYKLSALEIESKLLECPGVSEIACVGLPDAVYGEVVAAVIALIAGGPGVTLESLCEWGKERLAAYKLPRKLKIVDSLPRNAMGKINKKELVKVFAEEDT